MLKKRLDLIGHVAYFASVSPCRGSLALMSNMIYFIKGLIYSPYPHYNLI